MSFGFGIGDFLAVGKLVWSVYRAYADAPEKFRDISQEILSLHIIIQKVEDQLPRYFGFWWDSKWEPNKRESATICYDLEHQR